MLLQIRATSLKSVIQQFGLPASAVTPNQYYDAVNPQMTSCQLQIGESFYPTRPLNDCQRPAEAYPYLIQAISSGGSLTKNMGTSVSREQYNSTVPSIPANSDSTLVTPATGVRPAPAGGDVRQIVSKWPSSAYYGYDCEKCSGILFTGINSRASPPFFNLFLGGSTGSNTFLMNAWGIVDAIIEIDVLSKSVVAYV